VNGNAVAFEGLKNAGVSDAAGKTPAQGKADFRWSRLSNKGRVKSVPPGSAESGKKAADGASSPHNPSNPLPSRHVSLRRSS
jgi:hypothetical protein